MKQTNQNYLADEKIGTLMKKYTIPCIISLLVGALYNIVDHIFIANASYLGSYGNAANTVVFPLTIIALAVAFMIGDGCCAFVSLSLGKQSGEDAKKSIGNSVLLTIISGILLCIVYLCFSDNIISLFGGTVNAETFKHSKEYFFWISLGICSLLSQISLVAAMATINNMIQKYGLSDPIFGQEQYAQIPIAVIGIVMKFFQIVISVVVGIAAGCIPIVGFALVLPIFFGLDGVLYSMPVSDILTLILSAVVIIYTYKQLS